MCERVCYMVVANIPDEPTAAEYVRWLRNGHVSAVIEGGAETALIVRLDPGDSKPEGGAAGIQVMTQYLFPNRAAFERYIRESAPRLRAGGLARFGPERGIRMERRVGRVE